MLKHFLVPKEDQVLVSEQVARTATRVIFEHIGLTENAAEVCADVLISADLCGCESHGVSNMLRRYLEEYENGLWNPTPAVKIVRESAVTATLDGDRGIGLQVGPDAMKMAMDKAEEFGMGAVAVQNCGHVGMLAYYPRMALERDMVGVCMVSARGSTMVPTFGAEPAFGTHPIAWAAPAGKMPPFVFDIATTQVAKNKLNLVRRIGSNLEPGWIAGLDGNPIMDRVDVPTDGGFYMLPFGGTRENGSHKGYGFATVVDIMSGILSGNGPGFLNSAMSQFVMAFRIDAFVDVLEFKSDLDKLLEKLANMKPAPGCDRVYYAGLMEYEEERRRKTQGIPYHREVVEWFNSISAELKLNFELP